MRFPSFGELSVLGYAEVFASGVAFRTAQPLHDSRVAVIEENAFTGVQRRDSRHLVRIQLETENVEVFGHALGADRFRDGDDAALQQALGGMAGVNEVRGQGLIIGVELDRPCGALIGQAAEAGLLLSVTADSVIRIVPPLILTTAEADEIVAKLTPLVKAILAE